MNIPHPIRDRLQAVHRKQLIADVMREGKVSESMATAAVDEFGAEHPILDMLMTIDWGALLKLVLAFLPLFMAKQGDGANVV